MAVTSSIVEVLAGWVGHQRWFAGKGTAPLLRRIGALTFHEDDDLQITTHLIVDDSGERPVLYQVPVTLRRDRVWPSDHSYIGAVTDAGGELWHAYDGPHDPAFAHRLLEVIIEGGDVEGDKARAHGVTASMRSCRNVRSQVLSGEQSNTSIIYTFDSGDDSREHVICKIFRTLHHGENPDVVLQSALFAAGSRSVPATVGSLVGEWSEPGEGAKQARGHLAFAQEFIAGAEDAWRRALVAAAAAEDFTASARQIGIATADIHATLASALPTREATQADIAAMVSGWRERLDSAAAEVPELNALRSPIEALYARAQSVTWPRLQRIHGDLHLGQVLAVPGDRWAIIDFEGEPMRPLAERSLVDVPLRDVAGMLRSFDYVTGAQQSTPGIDDWSHACRKAFIDGYIQRSGNDVRSHRVLLDAFELDKALYEAVYEARNRPAWLPIPTAAVRRLAQRAHEQHAEEAHG